MKGSNTKPNQERDIRPGAARYSPSPADHRGSRAKELLEANDEILETLSRRHNPGILGIIKAIAERD